MWGMSLSLRDPGRRIDVATGVTVCVLLMAMIQLPTQQTLPYHLIFLLLAIVYGFRVWPVAPTALILTFVTVATGLIFYIRWAHDVIESTELIEIPLMPALLVAMVWHARRRVAAQLASRQMADEIQLSIERERAFLSDSSHAIRTPVTIARGHMELLTPALQGIAREDANVVLRQLSRMDQLAARLLALARLETGAAVSLQPLDIGQLVQEIASDWSPIDRQWTLDIGLGEIVLGDAEWLRIAVDALVENALKFTESGDPIGITCTVTTGLVMVSVSDSGPGVPEFDRPLVFDRFWHRTGDGHPTGSGLGLATVRAVAEAHAGQVDVSASTWGGAQFTVRLPLFQTQSPAPEPRGGVTRHANVPTIA
jgi:signal transduction histidine kinase